MTVVFLLFLGGARVARAADLARVEGTAYAQGLAIGTEAFFPDAGLGPAEGADVSPLRSFSTGTPQFLAFLLFGLAGLAAVVQRREVSG
ncbi:MAG: hypothetical protein PW734_11425 [Verrucomicrobium sp.]|nr:hypothetical protein [Verrucomicrobium sp.]